MYGIPSSRAMPEIGFRHLERVLFALDDAWPGDKKQPRAADSHGLHLEGHAG